MWLGVTDVDAFDELDEVVGIGVTDGVLPMRARMIPVAVPFGIIGERLGLGAVFTRANIDFRPRTLNGACAGIFNADFNGRRCGTGGVCRGDTVLLTFVRKPTVRRRVMILSDFVSIILSNAMIRQIRTFGTALNPSFSIFFNFKRVTRIFFIFTLKNHHLKKKQNINEKLNKLTHIVAVIHEENRCQQKKKVGINVCAVNACEQR